MRGCVRDVAICAALAMGLVASLQGRIEKKVVKTLPTVEEILDQPTNSLKKMSEVYDELAKRLQSDRVEMAADLAEKKVSLKKQLNALLADQRKALAINSNVSKEMVAVRASNEELQTEGTALMKANEELYNDIAAMHKQVNNAAEFITDAIEESEQMLYNSSKLKVLSVFDKMDEQHRRKSLVEEMKNAAMIQTAPLRDSPQTVLEGMISALNAAEEENKQEVLKLQSQFDAKAKNISEQTGTVLEQQSLLNATLEQETELHAKLLESVKYCHDAHQQLIKQSRNFRVVAERIGGKLAHPEHKNPIAKVMGAITAGRAFP